MRLARSKGNYIFAGATTVARQVLYHAEKMEVWYTRIDQITPLNTKQKKKIAARRKTLHSGLHKYNTAQTLTTTATNHAVTLVEQQAYPLLLQLSLEDADLMIKTLEQEERQLIVLKLFMPILAIVHPLAWISYGNFIKAFEAQMTCHHKVLEYFGESWQWLTKTVKEVIDGDTIYVYGLEDSIRFMGIDCPEIWHEDDIGKPEDDRYKAGREATAYTTKRLLGKKIKIKLYTKRDIYGRHLAKIYIGGKSFETELVREGHAKFKYYR